MSRDDNEMNWGRFIVPHKAKMHEASKLIPGHFANNKKERWMIWKWIKTIWRMKWGKVRPGQVEIQEISPESFID